MAYPGIGTYADEMAEHGQSLSYMGQQRPIWKVIERLRGDFPGLYAIAASESSLRSKITPRGRQSPRLLKEVESCAE